MKSIPALLILPCLALAATLAAAPEPALSAADRERLERGEVVVSSRPVGRGGFEEVVGIGLIEVPPERVFRALVDHDHHDEWVPFVVRSDAAPQPDGSVRNAQVLDLPAPIGDRRYTLRATAAVETTPSGKVWRTAWTYVKGSGNVADHHGSWHLTAHGPGRTLATYRMYTDPGGAVPAWAMNRASRRSVPWIFGGLRLQVRRGRYG